MDIRNFFKKPRLEIGEEPLAKPGTTVAESDSDSPEPSCSSSVTSLPTLLSPSASSTCNGSSNLKFSYHKYDIGRYLNSTLSGEDKYVIFVNTWTPPENFKFKKPDEKRGFRPDWLKIYAPWLAYSEVAGGALCKFCVLFKPKVHRGWQGSFIVTGFNKYKDFNESARNHVKSEWHQHAVQEGTHFLAIKENKKQNIISQISQSRADLIKKNRLKLTPIISTILFCGTHDIALRGKKSDEGNFKDLLKLRVEAGDTVLKDHLQSAKNAQYTSVRTEHEIIEICENLIASDIVAQANDSKAFSILADETADIAGIEQLSLGVRFAHYKDDKLVMKEEFLGFVELKKFDALTICEAILDKCEKLGLEMTYCVGQGYDGCSAMSGKENGVKSRIQKKYPNINFVHCSSHRLNLVVHDLNALAEVRNTIGTIKEIIKFFRESNIRRQMISSIPTLCGTRWTEQHKSIRLFQTNFREILDKLQEISGGFSNGKQKAHSLYCCATKPLFLLCLFIISKYSAILEPITHNLQNKQINLLDVQNHVKHLLSILNQNRNNEEFSSIFKDCEEFCSSLDIQLKIPRIASCQMNRANYNTETPLEYYRLSLFLPYIDSITSSLNIRFSDENTAIFKLFHLYPSELRKIDREQCKSLVLDIEQMHKIEPLLDESLIWYEIVTTSEMSSLEDMLNGAKFLPKIQVLLLKSLSLPVTTATIERSFSTLRRVKTWLRSTMSETRTSGLCMLSVHRKYIAENKTNFIENVIDKFGQNERRLVFLFSTPDNL